VSGRRKVPIVPALVVGFLSLALLAVNIANQQAFTALIGVAIIMFYLPYLGVTAPLLRARIRGEWPRPQHGPYFNMGRWGLPVNLLAVVYGVLVAINIAWPRADVYGTHWYFRWAAVEFIGASIIIGFLYYKLVFAKRPEEVLEEHRAQIEVPEELAAPAGDAVP
jgi:amino acid transporter